MGVGAGLYVYVVVVQKFTFAISSPDEFLLKVATILPVLQSKGRHPNLYEVSYSIFNGEPVQI